MTQEEKRQLLLKDLCARLPYGVKVQPSGSAAPHKFKGYDKGLVRIDTDQRFELKYIKPYLRPMSSMTEEEKEKLKEEHKKDEKVYVEVLERIANGDESARGTAIPHFAADWCNKTHFDYRGLIPMGLALEAPEGMYN